MPLAILWRNFSSKNYPSFSSKLLPSNLSFFHYSISPTFQPSIFPFFQFPSIQRWKVFLRQTFPGWIPFYRSLVPPLSRFVCLVRSSFHLSFFQFSKTPAFDSAQASKLQTPNSKLPFSKSYSYLIASTGLILDVFTI